MVGMEELEPSGDIQMYDLLVRRVREQRQRRDWGHDESAASPVGGGAGGTEQTPQPGA